MIFGIDPGTATSGFGIVDSTSGELSAVRYGTIRTSPDDVLPQRLLEIYRTTVSLFSQHQPDAVVVEQLFFSRNARTALAVGHARGVFLLAAAEHGVDVFEYTPLQVKQAVTGEGRAVKHQVAYMVQMLLDLDEVPHPDDAADALAIAMCHGYQGSGWTGAQERAT